MHFVIPPPAVPLSWGLLRTVPDTANRVKPHLAYFSASFACASFAVCGTLRGMKINMPTIDQVRSALAALSIDQLQSLGDASGVSWHTLYKIRAGTTLDPGIETVRAVLPLIKIRPIQRGGR